MDEILKKKLEDAVWVAHSLFERGKTSGSSANMSFLHDGNVYITASGTCFGTLTADDFAGSGSYTRTVCGTLVLQTF